MRDGTVVICEVCRDEVDPKDPNVVMLVRWTKLQAFGLEHEWVEGGRQSSRDERDRCLRCRSDRRVLCDRLQRRRSPVPDRMALRPVTTRGVR